MTSPAPPTLPRHVDRPITGWGNFPVQSAHLYRPEKITGVRDVVKNAPDARLIPRGLGRSYGDSSLNESGGVILCERIDRMLEFDAATGTLRAEGGVSMADIIATMLPRGWLLPVTPGTKFVTLAGAIAADVHGKNHHRDGCISAFVDSLELIDARGDVMRCARDENGDVFWATVGGMGLTGVILSATLRLRRVESAYVTVDYQRAENFDRAIDLFAAGDKDYPYSVAWIDCSAGGASLGRSVLMRGDTTPPAQLDSTRAKSPLTLRRRKLRRSIPFNMPALLLNRFSVRAFNALYYATHGDGRRIIDFESFFYPLDSIGHWNRMYGRRGFIQYQAVFPPESARAGLQRLLEQISASEKASFLAVLKSFGPQNQGMLSFPREGLTLALDFANTGDSLHALTRAMDRTVLDHGGRVYLAKDACMERESFNAMYPRLDEFRAVKARLDPQNRFSSSQSRRLGITPA
jgi:decaprenylphospho-beta-D-ribofuranose 2-oxidase